MPVRVGAAGWLIPAGTRDKFPAAGTLLERSSQRLSVVKINASFYRPHRHTTYKKWPASVPADFRFSVKLPKAITHERKLLHCSDLIERFA